MPESPSERRTYANVIICEKVLTEPDNVSSAIRIAEIFYHTPPPADVSLPMERQAVEDD